MAGILSGHSFRFLFQEDSGTVDRGTWWRGFSMIALPLVLMTAIWLALSGNAMAPVADNIPQPSGWTALAHIYLLLYAVAILLAAICYYNLGAKRLRARKQTPALAGLLPLAALLAGAAHWVAPRVGDALPFWTATAFDLVALAILVWNVAEMGVRKD